MLKRSLVIVLVALVIGLVAFGFYARRPAIALITPPDMAQFSPDLVARGATLASAGYCATCHTAKGGKPYAGGRGITTGFGTIYATNITPDPETGIGGWSEEAFRRAMHDGVARDGSHLFPAFPYDHFTRLTDADVSALYAYFMTREPVRAAARKNDLPFPLNIRALQAGWKMLFFRPGRFEADPHRSADWNRGAYLAEGLGHCGACHTPRNWLGAEKRGKAYDGALIDGWIAPPLSAANPSPLAWSEDELFAYLRSGISRYHGTAAGPMAPVVYDGLARLPDADLRAVARYVADLGGAAARTSLPDPAIRKALDANRTSSGLIADADNRLYAAACAACHYNSGTAPDPLRPDLGLNSALHLDDPANLIHVILYGITARDGVPGMVMPAFSTLSDGDVARIAGYLRATRTDKGPWPDLERQVAAIRAQGPGGH